jgi:hypothetical protein
VATGSRKENASNQESRAPFRFNRNGALAAAEFPAISATYKAVDDRVPSAAGARFPGKMVYDSFVTGGLCRPLS